MKTRPHDLPIPSVTFEQAEIHRYNTQLPDSFILGALNRQLKKTPNSKETSMVKSFFDNVPPDSSDKEYMTHNNEVIKFRDDLTDFVSEELAFLAPPPYHDYLNKRREEFRRKLQGDKQRFRNYVAGREQGLSLRDNPVPRDGLEFQGLGVPTTEGKDVDLLEGYAPGGVRANLIIQREIAGMFVHWSSKEYLKKRAQGEKPNLSRRIYLNPRTKDAVKVFKEVIASAKDADLAVKGKIYDRTFESNVMSSYNDQDVNKKDIRGDGIVLFATDEEANSLLGIAEQVYRNNPQAFKGRDISSVPLKLADGLGVGDEPDAEKGASLTSHRAGVLEDTLAEIRDRAPTSKEQKVQLFRSLWRSAAQKANINPDNMAFNAKKRK